MALADYEELAARSFEEPHDSELRAAMAVCADDLAQSGDPRGALITMEHALDAADLPRAKELRAAMHAHVTDHGTALLGGAAPLLAAKRTLSLEWRSGRLYGVSLDARYLTEKAKLSAGELVKVVLEAPAATQLRRLRVRVRTLGAVANIIAMLGKRTHPLLLEEIELASTVWPQQISTLTYLERPYFTALSSKYPNLWYFAGRASILSLPIADNQTVDRSVQDVLFGDDPVTPMARRLLGRALTSEHEQLRLAALERIARLGPIASAFARALTILLQPRVTTPQAPIVAALRALGPSHERALVLAKVSSRAADYDADTRKHAGAAAAEVRPR